MTGPEGGTCIKFDLEIKITVHGVVCLNGAVVLGTPSAAGWGKALLPICGRVTKLRWREVTGQARRTQDEYKHVLYEEYNEPDKARLQAREYTPRENALRLFRG